MMSAGDRVLEHYARALGRPCIRGSTSNDERALCLDNFKAAQAGVTLFLSKVCVAAAARLAPACDFIL